MNYAIVENDTGAILQTGTCDPSQFSVKGWAGVTARECAADVNDDTHEYVDGHFVALPGPNDAEKHEAVLRFARLERTILLQDSDWTQTSDSPLSDSKKAEWVSYRQALRDLTDNVAGLTDIDDVVWPTQPED